MINKKLVALTSVATLGLTLIPLIGVAADDGGVLISNAKVTFQLDTGAKEPLNPNNPIGPDGTQTAVRPIDTVTDEIKPPGTTGLLSIDFASSFNFSSRLISSATQTYSADPQEYRIGNDQTKIKAPLFVQVTDVREGEPKGWTLKVRQTDDFKSTDAAQTVLPGAIINITNGNVLDGQSTLPDQGKNGTISSVGKIEITQQDKFVMGAKAK